MNLVFWLQVRAAIAAALTLVASASAYAAPYRITRTDLAALVRADPVKDRVASAAVVAAVHKMALRYDPQHGNEVAQNVLAKVIASPNTFTSVADPHAYLRVTIQHAVADQYRSQKIEALNTIPLDEVNEEEILKLGDITTQRKRKRPSTDSPTLKPTVKFQGWDIDEITKKAEQRLPSKQFNVLSLQLDGYTSEEIGAQLGLKPSSVRRYQFATTSELRKWFEAPMVQSEPTSQSRKWFDGPVQFDTPPRWMLEFEAKPR